MKTLIDMQQDFDKVINDILYHTDDRWTRSEILENADALAKITKQKINSINLIQKADLMSNRHDRIDLMVGEAAEQSER